MTADATGASASSPADKDQEPPPPAGADVVVLAKSRRPDVISKLLLWLVFSVIFGMLPLLAATLKEGLTVSGASMAGVLGGGELFIVSAVIAAGSTGEILFTASEEIGRNSRIIGGGSCSLACVMNAIAYTVAFDADHKVISSGHIASLSVVMFILTACASGFSVGLVAGR